ncbi:LuxR family transcriptional regulator [Mycobacterium sp. WUMAC-067]|uniref:helix-turn-helix transcriptional regulator n=1 Tax=unclassified Mycobacterium TaxID=2642494 RepID=UPI001CD98F79|nr:MULTISPECIES: LuxR family transcriptional regulator [unclassified Mycobacterium]MCA2241768.1 LuxR family transcriptional regulator [Mycobacterium sp. WUMAC-067]MCA2314632.1 LuxR family transcriptional regulator [Mycobacterium sp. WUMAC-025]
MLANMTETTDRRAETPPLEPLKWSDLGVSELPTGTVTLLLADVEGSTRLWQTQPEEMGAAVARLDRTVSDLVAQHGGVRPVEQGEGDSFVVAFARASDAAAFALRLQLAPLAPISLRIGLHTGEVQLRDEANYVGPTINRTARLRDLAHGGQTVLSATTSDLLADGLPADAWLLDLGTHQLRDLPRPERVTQLCHPEVRNDFPPLRASKSTGKQHLPVQLTSFVGRDAEIKTVREIVAGNRLVTLTGAGGVGKTRLAVQIADRMDSDFADGVWYVDLAAITDRAVVPVAVTRALGLPDQVGRSTIDTLTHVIAGRHILIVLDNCEHLIEACSSLTVALLGACPAVNIFATSREPLRVPGEVAWGVPSLSLTDEAIALFTDRARQVRPDFVVSEHNSATVAEICERLDGMPLAIELAAARVRALSLTQILDSLHNRFRLLTGGARTAVRRQQTLRASVDWSHALLTEPERVLFRRAAVFHGGFDLDAAQAVCGDSDVESYQILDQLTLLIDKSLVAAEDGDFGTRYRMLETVRQYALEKLSESGEADAVRARHRDHYSAMAAMLDEPGWSGHQHRVEQAETEIDNLRAAFAWCRENGETVAAIQLASALQPLWLTRGRVREGRAWFDAALAGGKPHLSGVPVTVRARALADSAALDAAQNIHDRVDTALEALTIARELNDPALLVRALLACGLLTAYDAEAAKTYLDEALGLARELGDDWSLSQILAFQAFAAVTGKGDAIAARAAGEEGRAIADAVGDGYTSRMCRWCVALAQWWGGDITGAIAEFRDLVAESDAAHDETWKMSSLVSLGHMRSYAGQTSDACAAASAAVEAAADLGEFNQGFGYAALAVANLAAGDVEAAASASETAWRLLSVQPELAIVNVIPLAEVALARGDLTAARRWADAAVSVAPGLHQMQALAARARVGIAQGDSHLAERDAHDALTRAKRLEGQRIVPDVLECLAIIAVRVGANQHAAHLFGAATESRRRTGQVRFKIYDADYAASVATLREVMGEGEFHDAWTEGESLSIDEAIAYAQRGRGERKRPATGWDSLTPAELNVVRLVSEGLSNKDIAARLFLSARTVQAHLGHVYAKLAISSRVQLAQEASRHA